ncbi:MAG TPA: Hsp20/alpha crystallin family protein [Methanothrix sp.]|nr:Hsp20/alpha crystallin family protein [Methanothrix sp.]HRW81959.1 Hsp20/alpha crystallin family protein [Methanothrix sp.]
MTGLVPKDDFKRLQRRMNRLMEDIGISEPESRYMPEIRRVQDKMNQLIEDFMAESPVVPGAFRDVMKPLADVLETDEEVVVKMDLPGMEKGEIEITVAEDVLEVKAERKVEKEETKEDFYRKERSYSKFERSLKLPAEVKADESKANLKDGVLEIHLPKVEVTARKKVEIE